jgi:hypothetical protein
MMYPPCSPWVGWYGPWAPPPMHFHPRWLGPAEGFGHGGYYVGDDCYGYVSHQQDNWTSSEENWMVQNSKPDGLISMKTAAAPSCQLEREALKDGSSTDQPGRSQGKTGPGSKSLANAKAKSDAGKASEEVAAEQNRVPEGRVETRIEAGTSSQQLPNQTVQFPKLDHLLSPASGQEKASRTITPGMTPTPCWYPLDLTHSQRRRIQQMRAQKMSTLMTSDRLS